MTSHYIAVKMGKGARGKGEEGWLRMNRGTDHQVGGGKHILASNSSPFDLRGRIGDSSSRIKVKGIFEDWKSKTELTEKQVKHA